jgi:hypothetical protein
MVRQTFEQVVAFPDEVGVPAIQCADRRQVFFVLDVINSSALWSSVRVEKPCEVITNRRRVAEDRYRRRGVMSSFIHFV